MEHSELYQRIATVVEEQVTAGYLLHWAADGHPLPTFISLIPHANGTVTATQGDLRERIIPVVDDAGNPRVFPDESSACEWAWQEIQSARRPPTILTAEQQARFAANGEEQRRRRGERNAQWKAEHGDTHGNGEPSQG